jgi:hypothetical protein
VDAQRLGFMNDEIIVYPPQSNGGRVRSYVYWLSRECIAGLFWLYIIIKAFIFDIDVFIFDVFSPGYIWILKYKFFILTGIIFLIWLFTKNGTILPFLAYIAFYPFKLLFWRIPLFIFRQRNRLFSIIFRRPNWLLAVAIFNSVMPFFLKIKRNCIIFSCYLISFIIILIIQKTDLLWIPILVILTTLFLFYVNRFILVFKPSIIFRIYSLVLDEISKARISELTLNENIRSIPISGFDQEQLGKWTRNLKISIITNRFLLFFSKKLRDYQSSMFYIISYIFSSLITIFITILSFAISNYGIFKMNSEAFSYTSAPTLFTFFYYSFNSLVFNFITEVTPSLPISQSMLMIEYSFSILIITILLSLFFSVGNEKYTNDLNKIILNIEEEGRLLESLIREEYGMNSIEEAVQEIKRLEPDSGKVFYIVDRYIKI